MIEMFCFNAFIIVFDWKTIVTLYEIRQLLQQFAIQSSNRDHN